MIVGVVVQFGYSVCALRSMAVEVEALLEHASHVGRYGAPEDTHAGCRTPRSSHPQSAPKSWGRYRHSRVQPDLPAVCHMPLRNNQR